MKEVLCNLCGSGSSENILLFSTYDYITHTLHIVVKCKACGLVYVNPQPTEEELPKFYPETYYGNAPFLYEIVDARSRYKKFQRIVGKRTGKLLDVGCGKGLLLKLLKESGWEVIGTELSKESAKYANEVLGLKVFNQDIEECNFTDESFDLITFFHSLEHLINPLSTLKTIRRLLKDDGLLIVEVPRFHSLYFKIFKDKWFHLDVPRHLFHFDDQTLEKLLTTSGFKVFRKKKYAIMYDAFGALQSLLNYICSTPNLLNNINTKCIRVKDILKSKQKKLMMDTIISFSLQPLLFPPLLLFAVFLSIFNIGGTLTYYAKK